MVGGLGFISSHSFPFEVPLPFVPSWVGFLPFPWCHSIFVPTLPVDWLCCYEPFRGKVVMGSFCTPWTQENNISSCMAAFRVLVFLFWLF